MWFKSLRFKVYDYEFFRYLTDYCIFFDNHGLNL